MSRATWGCRSTRRTSGRRWRCGRRLRPVCVIPILGPSSVRDASGEAVGAFAYLPWQIPKWADFDHRVTWQWSLTGIDLVQTRASLLDATDLLEQAALDRYAFLRDAYSSAAATSSTTAPRRRCRRTSSQARRPSPTRCRSARWSSPRCPRTIRRCWRRSATRRRRARDLAVTLDLDRHETCFARSRRRTHRAGRARPGHRAGHPGQGRHARGARRRRAGQGHPVQQPAEPSPWSRRRSCRTSTSRA